MKKKFVWKFVLLGATVVLSFVFLIPNMPFYASMPDWWKNSMPDKGISLGLDLQGGIHLVFEVQGERAVEIATERIAFGIADTIKTAEAKAEVSTDGGVITVSESTIDIRKAIEDDYPLLEPVDHPAAPLAYRITDREARRLVNDAADQALETIRNRVDQFGVAEPTIQRQGENEIVVQLPGIKEPKRAIDLIGKTALLEFKIVDDEAPVAAELPSYIKPSEEEEFFERFGAKVPEGDEIIFQRVTDRESGGVRKYPFVVKKKALLTGELLSDARVSIDQRFNEPYVSMTFNPAGAKIFEDITGEHTKKRLAIILDNNLYSAPVIQERIGGGNAQITGTFTLEEAKDLAIVLQAGALPAPLNMLQNLTVGPSLGRDSIEAGKIAGIIAFLLVVVFMIVYYRLSGLVADFALILNLVLLLGAMGALNATLTLPGIAGIILAVGIAVDSNVLMFERMRDELRAGKTPRAAVDSGYDKAFLTIVDSHVTTLITAAVLFQFGTGPIKGFAVTLSIGIAINLFTALVGTKSVFDWINSTKEVKKLSI